MLAIIIAVGFAGVGAALWILNERIFYLEQRLEKQEAESNLEIVEMQGLEIDLNNNLTFTKFLELMNDVEDLKAKQAEIEQGQSKFKRWVTSMFDGYQKWLKNIERRWD